MVENHKLLYKLEVLFLKLIPMLIAICCLLNATLSYFYIETEILSYIAGIGILPISFLYLSSYVFKFCLYHRIFLHYVVINNAICFIDDKYGIPLEDREFLLLHILIFGTCLFIILYLKFRICKH